MYMANKHRHTERHVHNLLAIPTVIKSLFSAWHVAVGLCGITRVRVHLPHYKSRHSGVRVVPAALVRESKAIKPLPNSAAKLSGFCISVSGAYRLQSPQNVCNPVCGRVVCACIHTKHVSLHEIIHVDISCHV